MKLDELKREIDEIANTSRSSQEFMQHICEKLNDLISKYNWVGFYMVDEHDPELLNLGQFKGPNTPHKQIRFDQGICGAAARLGVTINVPDVKKDKRFLACSVETKSEIVVPVFVRNKDKKIVVGELDIDSNTLAAFEPDDVQLVEYCAKKLGEFLERNG